MDINAEFLYGVASVFGVLSILVAIYGFVYKVPVGGLVALLKDTKDYFISKADDITKQNLEKKNQANAVQTPIGEDKNSKEGALS